MVLYADQGAVAYKDVVLGVAFMAMVGDSCPAATLPLRFH